MDFCYQKVYEMSSIKKSICNVWPFDGHGPIEFLFFIIKYLNQLARISTNSGVLKVMTEHNSQWNGKSCRAVDPTVHFDTNDSDLV